jgi:hypothetical protein
MSVMRIARRHRGGDLSNRVKSQDRRVPFTGITYAVEV